MKAAVIGGGSWGTAFSLYLARQNIKTNLWVREKEIYEELVKTRINNVFLPGHRLPPDVFIFNQLEEAIDSAEIIFIAVPSKFCREIYKILAPNLSPKHIIVSLTKGIEDHSLKRMSEVMEETFLPYFEPRIAVLSGPSFAKEVAQGHPTAVVIASRNRSLAKKVQHLISSLTFRIYTSEDIIGVEVAGAVKNVIAIASGISDALRFGSNSVAALVTRGLAEMVRLGVSLGARKETFSGLAGIGDLVLTCTGRLSRNRYVGYELGRGKKLADIISRMTMVAEGVVSTLSVRQLALREGVELPICEQVYEVLYNNKDPRKALHDLMSRRLKNEYE